jgi:hypothetical protein
LRPATPDSSNEENNGEVLGKNLAAATDDIDGKAPVELSTSIKPTAESCHDTF